MLINLNKKEETLIEQEIKQLEKNLRDTDPINEKEEYKTYLTALDSLYTLRNKAEQQKKGKIEIDPNVILSGIFGLVSLGVVLHYEQLHVITSKAFNFVLNRIPGKRV